MDFSVVSEKLLLFLFAFLLNSFSPSLYEQVDEIFPLPSITSPTPTPSGPLPVVLPLRLYEVKRVVDGDTIVIESNGQNQTVRLIGVNSPESVDPRKEVECFGREASEFVKNALTSRKVYLETDPTQDTYDRYKRLLAFVFLEDGTNFNQYLISQGYAFEYTYETPYKYQNAFQQAEDNARDEGKGLWSENACQ